MRWLRKNDEYARAVGQAGRARMTSLGAGGLADFIAELLTQYSRRQQARLEAPSRSDPLSRPFFSLLPAFFSLLQPPSASFRLLQPP